MSRNFWRKSISCSGRKTTTFGKSRSLDDTTYNKEKIITSNVTVNTRSWLGNWSLINRRYNKLTGNIKQLANRISLLDPRDPFRAQQEKALLEKLYNMGIITSTSKFSDCSKVTVSAFCRRRLPIVMCRLKMAETVKEAVTFVEQGHVRVGPQTITDPAFLVTRTMEDFVTWVDTSKIKRKIMKYNDKVYRERLLQCILCINMRKSSWTISIFCKCVSFYIYLQYILIIFHHSIASIYVENSSSPSEMCRVATSTTARV